MFVLSGIEPVDPSFEMVLTPPYETALAPVAMGEMFSQDFLIGTPAGGPALRASGMPFCVFEVEAGAFPPAGFSASGTATGLGSSHSSSDLSQSSSL